MASLANLKPAERARLLGKPEGELGIAIGKVMNQTNAKIISTVYHRLGLKVGHRVLEIGFGNGQTVPLLMQLADELNYVGIRNLGDHGGRSFSVQPGFSPNRPRHL
jgi:hypothetical protein